VTAQVRAELLRIRRTRAAWGLLAAALALTLAWTSVVLSGIGGVGGYAPGSPELRDALVGAAGIGALPVLLLGVLAVTWEFHHRTATATYLTTPHRARVVAAKAVAAAVAAVPAAWLLVVAALAVGVLAGAVNPADLAGALLPAVRVSVAFSCYAVLGAGLGAVTRNQTLGVVLPLLWFGVVEQLLPSYGMGRLVPWTPGGAAGGVAGSQLAGVLPMWVALLVLASYAAALLVPGTRAIAGRDIT
jgi:ABC-2 type transport system permease protein